MTKVQGLVYYGILVKKALYPSGCYRDAAGDIVTVDRHLHKGGRYVELSGH